MDEFPSNSLKVPGAKPTPSKDRETTKVKKVVQGETVRRKKSRTTRLKEVLIGTDPVGAGEHIFFEIMVPAAKDMVADVTTSYVERLLFGESRSHRRSRGGIMGSVNVGKVNYGGISSASRSRREDPRERIGGRTRVGHLLDEIDFDSRVEAEEVLDTMYEILSTFKQVSVADFYEMAGHTGDYTDTKYGWTEIPGAKARRIRSGAYVIDLPRPEPLD